MTLQDWLFVLLFTAASAFQTWRGFATGYTIISTPLGAHRSTHPIGFWAIQCFWMFSAVLWPLGTILGLLVAPA